MPEQVPAPPAAASAARPVSERLARLVPAARVAVRRAHKLAAVSAGAAALTAGLCWAEGWLSPGAAAVLGALLLAPAAGTWLAAWTLSDFLDLPARLRASAEGFRGELAGARESRAGLLRLLWAARGLVGEAQGGWLRGVAMLRLVRLSSLPFLLLLAAAVVANAGVIALGAGVAVAALVF